MSEDEILKAGIAALKSGNRKQASAIFSKFVQDFPRSERGWYLLGMSVSTIEQQRYCFQRVLAINPKNQDAKKQIALLSTPKADPPPPAWATQPPPVRIEPQPVSKPIPASQQPVQPISQPVSPFIYEEVEAADESPPRQKTAEKKPPAKKKKSDQTLVYGIAASLVIVCVFALGTIYLLSTLDILPSFGFGTPPTQKPPSFVVSVPTATSAAPTPIPTALPTVVYMPRYEEAPCQFDTPNNVRVTCGYAIVPEDRTGDPNRTIRLAVAIFHSTSPNPAPDPVVFLQGGPGGQAIELSAAAYSVLVEPFISERDYIAFDQRGTGLSEPALDCDELDKVYRQDIYGTIDASARELVYQNAFLSCAGLLQSKGINLKAYHTVENAADLKDIVNLLGYQKVNLYGASYGTRLALVTMRNHPEIVRTSILDSVMPVEVNWVNEFPGVINYTLSNLFASCKVDPGCNTAYPDIEATFWELVQELDTNPVTLTTSAYPMGTVTETIDGSYLISVVMGLSKNTNFIDTAPQTIYRLKSGDYSTLIAAQYALPYSFDGINPGLYISVICREHVLDSSPEELLAASQQINTEQFIWRPFYENLEKMFGACKTWGAVGPVLGEKDAVVSDIPSLVITGTFDSATPPQFGKQVAEKLPNSHYVEFPNQGHVPTAADSSGCAMKITQEFLRNPTVEPDRSCMNELPKVEFLVPYTGEPPLELTNERIFGVTVDIPTDWFFTFDGFFVRGSSPFDITQVSALRAAISIQELKDYFSSSIHGYRGLDGAPIEAGTRDANGYKWKLYYATSNGRPVDVAAAEDGFTSLIIIMFSHPDEHEALYRTVFLPMVDSAK
ncbi:MAG TPA: alpha/beta fold hydrolase [Anaerolineales bacterium]|nr:alpha/beta fold hydrolase [Anaerolineales bacterium]